MLALLFDQSLRLVSDFLCPERRPGEARLGLRLAGICDTDLQLVRGYMGFRGVLGHELVAEVLEADDPTWVGRRVVADINLGCGHCSDCLERDGHHCERRSVLGILGHDGAFAEELVVPSHCLRAVPDGVSDELAVFAEPLAAALHVLDDLPPGTERVTVLGDGKLGLLIALALRGEGLGVLLVGHHRAKLALAAAVGAEVRLESELKGAGEEARAMVVVEATGSERGLERALTLLRPRGRLILKTTTAEAPRVDLSRVVVNELSLIGSRCGDLGRALAVLEEGKVDPRPLVSARYPLREAATAFEHATRSGVLKVLLSRK